MLGLKTKILYDINCKFSYFAKPTKFSISPVGYRCNHNCPMCWRGNISSSEKSTLVKNELNRLSVQEYKDLFATIPNSIKNVVIVGGGEPLLYPGITDVFKFIKLKNIEGELITNGSLLNGRMSDALVACSWDKIRISINSASIEVFKKVNGASDFDRVINNIKLLLKKRGKSTLPKLSLYFVIQKDNYYELKKFVRMAETIRVDRIEFIALIPLNSALVLNSKQIHQVISDLREIKEYIQVENNIDYVLEMFSLHHLWSGINHDKDYFKGKYCDTVQSGFEMACDGTVVPCCFANGKFDYLNIRSKSLLQIWKEYRKFRMDLINGKFYPFCYSLCVYKLPIKPKLGFR